MNETKLDTFLIFTYSNISISFITGLFLGIWKHNSLPMKEDIFVGFFLVNSILFIVFAGWHLVKSFYKLFL
jgi:hypothetical protein